MADRRSLSGQAAENIAAQYLIKHGYRIIDQNFKCRTGELDIIARESEFLCIVEVRYRRTSEHGHPLETVNAQKIRRIIRATEEYLAVYKGEDFLQVRFDVVGILGDLEFPEIILVQEAFEA
jgi:putative endonuclease